ncbi:SIS domain-containing protein [Candidatus Poribacteria bacterium]|jgi:uncharacterized phosphosugar-binding protein|nr:SIS domain-containing protein [Candidatus Poribacteria bacterium]MBT5535712.1 SIS domain-containing protein [Candidatus Poribacteria bacterium]MBT7808324.1 SIS domain-containing protein [Candidatus Poribacteria bacterium]
MSDSPTRRYYSAASSILSTIMDTQADNIRRASEACAAAILGDRLVHLFGSGHSRIPVEEVFPRYGSFPGFHPIVELSLTFHNAVVGANGQRQAMFIENVPGLAARILRNFSLSADDVMLVFSNSGTNVVPVEMAQEAGRIGMTTIAVTSEPSAAVAREDDPTRAILADVCDIVIDTGVPPGDAVVWVDDLDTPVSPVSSIGGCFVANALKAEVAQILTEAGKPPSVLTSSVHVGRERSAELFEETYDDYRRRVRVLFDD